MLTFLSIADKRRPKWIVWENVPGVLSSNGGRDFGTFLGALGELGYGFAYRVLDAQFFGVAQRRRRVFVVGYLGDWRPAAAVLFESESLQRNPKPSRAKRQETSTDAEGSVRATGFAGNVESQVAACLQTTCDDYSRADGFNTVIEQVAQPIPINTMTVMGRPSDDLNPRMGIGIGNPNDPCPTLTKAHHHAVAQPQYFESHPNDSRVTGPHDVGNTVSARYGTGGGNTPIVSQPIAFQSVDYGGDATTNLSPILRRHDPMAVAQPVHAFKVRGGCEGGGKGYLGEDEKAFTISATQDQQVAQPIPIQDQATRFQGKRGDKQDGKGNGLGIGNEGDVIYTLTKADKHAVAQPIAVDAYNQTINEKITQTIGSSGSDINHIGGVLQTMAIRRLTPKECERLQGFPDDWTKIPYRNKPAEQCPDGPRYKACGNSMAVPVMRWIGTRIQMIENYLNP
jgi:DNA (cytosine-5)-methyltransferase 1